MIDAVLTGIKTYPYVAMGVGIFLGDLHRVICGSVILYDDFVQWICLIDDTIKLFFQIFSTIIGTDHD